MIMVFTNLRTAPVLGEELFPLLFNPQENSIELPPLVLEYSFQDQDLEVLKVGPYLFSHEDIRFLGWGSSAPSSSFFLTWKWPKRVIPEGDLQVIGRSGKNWGNWKFNEQNSKNWESLKLNPSVASVQPRFQGRAFQDFKKMNALMELPIDLVQKLKKDQPFRFCLTSSESVNERVYSSRLCSHGYGVMIQKDQLQILGARSSGQPRVLLNQNEISYRGSIVAPENTQFYAETKSGLSFEFDVLVVPTPIIDISEDPRRPQMMNIVGYDQLPYSKFKIIQEKKYSRFTEAIGFQATIGDFRKFYSTEVPKNQKHTYYRSIGGGVFRQDFEFESLPSETDRPQLYESNIRGTYVDGARLFGKKSASSGLSSEQNEILLDSKDKTKFIWKFGAPNKGKLNKSQVQLVSRGKTFTLSHEMYRGFSTEASARGSVVGSQDGVIALSELSVTHWFENVLGWENNFLSTQRWGINGKIFRSLTKFPGNNAYNFETGELKYRLNRGIWTRDEAIGILGAVQNTQYGPFKATLYGPGVFWARSMPPSLDMLISWLPFMDAKKWLHLEFMYYANSLKTTTIPYMNVTLNFYGQVLWTDRFFGEFGTSYKRFDIGDVELNRKFTLNTFFLTGGLGYKF